MVLELSCDLLIHHAGVDDDNISSFLDLSPSEQATAVMHDLFFSAETPSMVQLSPLLCGGQPGSLTLQHAGLNLLLYWMFLQILRLMMSSQPVERNPTPTRCSSELNKVAIIIPNYSTVCMTHVYCIALHAWPLCTVLQLQGHLLSTPHGISPTPISWRGGMLPPSLTKSSSRIYWL